MEKKDPRQIKFAEQKWASSQQQEKKTPQIKLTEQKWAASQKEEKKTPQIKLTEQKWNQSQPNEKKPKDIKFQENRWEQTKTRDERKEPIQPQKPVLWHQVPGIQQPIVNRLFEGINELSPFAIKDSNATRNKNITTDKFPALSVRTGFSSLGGAFGGFLDGLAVYKGTELHAIAGGVWYAYKNSAWTSLKTGLSAGSKWSFVNFQGSFTNMSLIATNGKDVALKYDGTSVSNLANAPALVNFATTHDNRVYLASRYTLFFSALRKAEDWSTVNDSGSIVVETTDGGDITGMAAASGRLTVFKKNSIHELFGTRAANFQMKIVTENLGTPTGNSIQTLNGMMYFLGNDGIYKYSGGSLPSNDFSLPVQKTIQSINKTKANLSVSWTDGERYYLGIPTGTATYPNTYLEYDPRYNTWNTWDFTARLTVGCVQMDGVMYGGTDKGNVIKFDGSAKDISNTGNAGTDSANISYEWVTKPFSFASLASKSRWFRLWLVADLPTGSTMTVSISTQDEGDTDWTTVQTITASTDIQSKEILIPTTLANNSNWVRLRITGTGTATIYEISRQERVFPMGNQ